MVSLSYFNDYGSFDFYLMPYFIERVFPGTKGRPRLAFEVDKNNVIFESSAKKNKVDVAIRYSTVVDDFDIGVSHFYGNNRSPNLTFNNKSFKLGQYYPILSQTSLDLQSTKGAWLYKLEALLADDGG